MRTQNESIAIQCDILVYLYEISCCIVIILPGDRDRMAVEGSPSGDARTGLGAGDP